MAGQKSNVIEYVFQGNTLDLQQAIKQVNSLLTQSTKKFKSFQDGALTKEQEAKVKATRKLLKQLKEAAKKESKLTDDQRKRTLTAGRAALRQSRQLAEQASKAEIKAQRAAEAEKLRMIKLTSVAGQENAAQHAAFLDNYADKLKNYLSPAAYDEIKNAVLDYQKATKDTTISQEDLAAATEQVNQTYRNYSETLQTAARVQSSTQQGILSFSDLMRTLKLRVLDTVKSFHFWIAAARKVVNILKQGILYAADYAEAINYLTVVAGEYGDELERFITLQERAFGADPTQLRTTAAMFYQIGNSLGWSDRQAALLSETFTKLAQDMASLQNVSLEVATEKLRAGLTGQSRALKAWGIDVQDATVEEWLLTKGINASMESMNEASQTAARYAYILEKTSNAHGDLARTLDSPANQMKIFSTQSKLLAQNLGGLVLPVVAAFVRILNAVLRPLNAFLQAFTASSVEGYTKGIGEGTDALEDMEEQAEATAVGLTGLDEINQEDKESTLAFGTEGGSLVNAQVQELINGYDNLAGSGDKLVEVFARAGEALSPLFEMMSSSPIDFTDALTFLGGALELVVTPLEWISSLIQKLPNWMEKVVGGAFEIASAVLAAAAAVTIFKTLAGSKVFTTFVGVLKGMWTSFINLTKAIVQNTVALLKQVAAAVKAKAVSVATKIALWWEAAAWWKKAIAVIAAAGMLAAVVAGVALGAAAVAESKANSSMNTSFGSVPAMAKGGVATGPTFALIGEGRYNEAVMPLGNSPQFKAMKQEIAAETAQSISSRPVYGSTGGASRPIILQLNGREVARGILPELGYTQAQTGVKFK